MTIAVLQATVLCTFAYVQVNEGLANQNVNAKAYTPTLAKVNITSLSFLAPLKDKLSKYSTTIKDFLQKKFIEFKIITSGLLAALNSTSTPGAPVMQVTRPFMPFKPQMGIELLAPLNQTKH